MNYDLLISDVSDITILSRKISLLNEEIIETK
jgi:hypothetical protein